MYTHIEDWYIRSAAKPFFVDADQAASALAVTEYTVFLNALVGAGTFRFHRCSKGIGTFVEFAEALCWEALEENAPAPRPNIALMTSISIAL
jgi:hypothetical protein